MTLQIADRGRTAPRGELGGALHGGRMTFVPADFLAGIPAHLSSTRRVLVTQAALYGVDRPSKLDEIRSAMQIWSLEQRQRPGVTTVLSILLELEALGAIGGFDVVEGGFVVRGKERAA